MTVLVKAIILKFKFKAQIFLGFLFFIYNCSPSRYQNEFTGQTMGTTYNVKIITNQDININEISKEVNSLLTQINNQMSTWDLKSEITKFNLNNSDTMISLSPDFFKVVKIACEISDKTDGAFDITIFDLMSLWGFGPNPKEGSPNNEEINNALKFTGWKKLFLDNDSIKKKNPNVKLDLNAIAKGYGVDLVHNKIISLGFNNVFVEIGGEVKCSGKNKSNKKWRIGIEDPNISKENIIAVIDINDKAVATSGNYRNFLDINGKLLGHTIDPRIGKPVSSNILSATVISSSCIKADAWATALMVLDFKKGKEKIESDSDLDAIWILENGDGSYFIEKTKNIDLIEIKN